MFLRDRNTAAAAAADGNAELDQWIIERVDGSGVHDKASVSSARHTGTVAPSSVVHEATLSGDDNSESLSETRSKIGISHPSSAASAATKPSRMGHFVKSLGAFVKKKKHTLNSEFSDTESVALDDQSVTSKDISYRIEDESEEHVGRNLPVALSSEDIICKEQFVHSLSKKVYLMTNYDHRM